MRFVYIAGRSGNMIDFEQWYEQEIGSENKPEYEAAKWAWEYQQAKIDEINEVANGWKDEYRIMSLRYERSKKRIDELQGRIDAIHDIIERAKKSRSGNYLINEIGNILKGNKDD